MKKKNSYDIINIVGKYGDTVEFKKTLIVLTITLCIFSALMLGSSYAWYAYSNAETSLFGSTIKEAPTVIFAQNEKITAVTNMPIQDEDRYSYANINSFNITYGENLKKYDVAISIYLDEIVMSQELKIENYKYELMENNVTISSGNFKDIFDNKEMILLENKIVEIENYPTTHVYDLFIWLSDDGENQNELMDKYFSAKVKINTAVKKKSDEHE